MPGDCPIPAPGLTAEVAGAATFLWWGGSADPFCLTLFFVVLVLHTANLYYGLDSTVLGTSTYIYIYICIPLYIYIIYIT